MKFIIRNSILIFLVAVLNSCLEPYEPEILDGSNNFLVVDGVITNKPGPYTIKVTKSYSVNGVESDAIKVTGLTLTIEEENGPIETLVETEDGIYQTNMLQGKTGASYRIVFEYEGNQYQSSWEKINSSSPIDSVYYNVETKQTINIGTDITGVQFYIDSKGSLQDAIHYRYEWEETWEIGVFYPSFFDYVGNGQLMPTTDPRHTCWRYQSQSVINIATTESLSENVVSGHSLAFITGEEERFIRKHSLLIKQYALNEEEYAFWKALQESNEQLGSLYDKQPANIKGNIFNLSSPSELVLGYFSASGVQEKRMFINDLQDLSRKKWCSIPLDTLFQQDFGATFETVLFGRLRGGYFLYDILAGPGSTTPEGAILSASLCSDCTKKGGDLNKPIYWDD